MPPNNQNIDLLRDELNSCNKRLQQNHQIKDRQMAEALRQNTRALKTAIECTLINGSVPSSTTLATELSKQGEGGIDMIVIKTAVQNAGALAHAAAGARPTLAKILLLPSTHDAFREQPEEDTDDESSQAA